jgi:pimeloyl-ACP methyl ester carboxylesterase
MTTLELAPPVAFLDLDGFRLAYREWGAPGATDSVVLIHGITSSSLSWVRVAPALADRFRVVAMDLKGHGDSGRPASGYQLADQAREVDRLCEGLGLAEPIVIGHSWGGAIALILATSTARARRLVLEDPAIGWREADPAERVRRRDGYAVTVGLSPEAAAAQVRANVAPGWTEADVAGKIDAVVKTSPDAVRAVFDSNGAWALHDLLPRLTCPTLLLRAPLANGGIVDDEAVSLAQSNPKVRVVDVPEADHNIHRGRFETFMTEVERFLA